jgi:predicted DsbA family dithiol-disulfide isomerase
MTSKDSSIVRPRLDVWSDIACPWCFIGKRRLDAALSQLPEGDRPEVVFHAFELRPDLPEHTAEPARPMLESKFGGAVRFAQVFARVQSVAEACGITYDLDGQLAVNTRLAHRGVVLARRLAEEGGRDPDVTQGVAVERFFQAFFEQGKNLADIDTVAGIVADAAGVDAAVVRGRLADGEGTAEVIADEDDARSLAITGVPFFVLNGRLSMSGAQETDTFVDFLAER